METIVRIEIPFGSNLKYEYCPSKQAMVLDRVLTTSMCYPGNYGGFIDTLGLDGDELDALIITDYAIHPGTLVHVHIIGALIFDCETGKDENIICVPQPAVDPLTSHIKNMSDLNPAHMEKIKHFFLHYIDLENDKWSQLCEVLDKSDAEAIFQKRTLNSMTEEV